MKTFLAWIKENEIPVAGVGVGTKVRVLRNNPNGSPTWENDWVITGQEIHNNTPHAVVQKGDFKKVVPLDKLNYWNAQQQQQQQPQRQGPPPLPWQRETLNYEGPIRYAGRDIIVLLTKEGRQPFYRSTGNNSGRPGKWFPFDGLWVKSWFDKTRFVETPGLTRFGTDHFKMISDKLATMNIPSPSQEHTDPIDVNKFLNTPRALEMNNHLIDRRHDNSIADIKSNNVSKVRKGIKLRDYDKADNQ